MTKEGGHEQNHPFLDCRRARARLRRAACGEAKDIKATRSAGAYRVELNLLDAEPFADAAGMPGQGITTGGGMPGHAGMMMVVKGGAPPVQPDAPSHPNHHLVVHVYEAASGKAATNATVAIGYTPLRDGKPQAPRCRCPWWSWRPWARVRHRPITATTSPCRRAPTGST